METTKRSRSIGPRTYDYRKEHTVFSHQIARDIHLERQREIERRMQFRIADRSRTPRLSVRRYLGHGLIHIGSVLAAEVPVKLEARR
jgi:hypothetical protein